METTCRKFQIDILGNIPRTKCKDCLRTKDEHFNQQMVKIVTAPIHFAPAPQPKQAKQAPAPTTGKKEQEPLAFEAF
jgi:hypothetical protein